MDLALLLLALVGHAAAWIGLVNRVHAVGLSRGMVRTATAVGFAALVTLPVALVIWAARLGSVPPGPEGWLAVPRSALGYFLFTWLVAPPNAAWWAWCRFFQRTPKVVLGRRGRIVRFSPPRGEAPPDEDRRHHALVNLPGNQILQVELAERDLEMPRLDPALDGLSIVHLSDLHFTGRVGKAFFQEVVRAVNDQRPDLVALTGDLVDVAACLDWIPDTLGRLHAPLGVFFVLGNHDLRVGAGRLRRELAASGLVDLGGRWTQVEARGRRIVLAGNELPWIPPAADLRAAPARDAGGQPLRVLLAHSPDQFAWARAHDVDLMLAGHLHGGQIRLPLVGAVLSPSYQGVRYSSGTFYRRPTILHVSRGLSGEFPIRFNCPPELTRLVLCSGRH